MNFAKRAALIAAFTLASCSSQAIPAATPTANIATLRVYTTHTTASLMNELVGAYGQMNPTAALDVRSAAFPRLIEVATQPNAPAYVLSNHLPQDLPLWAAPIGQDGLAVVLHPQQPVDNLTANDLSRIYQGSIVNWREVGGRDERITVITRERGSSTFAEFERLVMGSRTTTPNAIIAPSSAAMLNAIQATPGAVGYLSVGNLPRDLRPIRVDGIAPTRENIANNTYPLRSTLFVIGPTEPQGVYRDLIAWMQSQDGQTIIARRYAPLLSP